MSESKPVLLQIEGLPAEIEAQLAAIYSVHRIGADALADAPAPSVAVAEAVVTGGGTGLPRAWIEAMPALRIIAINGVGTDRVDLGFARARGIDVTTTPGALTDAVAELALGLTLAVMRRIVTGDAFVRAGQWAARAPFPLGGGLRGRRLGILGLGQIGLATGRLAEAFGMRVRYWNRTPRSDVGGPPCPTRSPWPPTATCLSSPPRQPPRPRAWSMRRCSVPSGLPVFSSMSRAAAW